MLNPSEQYLDIRERCLKASKTIPTRFLRAHLDFTRAILRAKTGLYPMVITIGANTGPEIMDLFPRIDRSDIIVRVSGQHYGANRILF